MHPSKTHFALILLFSLSFGFALQPDLVLASNLKQARHAFRKGQFKRALHLLQQLEKAEPSAARMRLQGHIFYAQKKYGKAARSYQEAIRFAPKTHLSWLHNDLGNSYFRQKRWKRAISHYGQALSHDPKYERARYNLELALSKRQRQPPPPPPPRKSKKRKPPPPPPPGRKKQKKPPKLRARGTKSNSRKLKMPKANRLKLQPFDQFLPYWRLLRHQANQKQIRKKP